MALTKVSYSMINGAPINVCDFGFSTTNSAASNSAILLSLLPGGPTGVELVIPDGDYNLDPLVLENMSYVTIRGIGRVNLIFTTGTAAITLGDVARVKPVRRCIFDNLRIIGSGALTYGVRMLYAVDICMYNVTIEVDQGSAAIGTGLYVENSWNNNFYQLIVKASNGIDLNDDGANNNNFFGGRCDAAVIDSGYGIRAAGKANGFYGFDVENWDYGCIVRLVTGFTLSGCYFEANEFNDIFFDGTAPAYGVSITGCFFDVRTHTSNAIFQSASGSGSSGVAITGNLFIGPPAAAFIVMTANCNNWFVASNDQAIGGGTVVTGEELGIGNWVQNAPPKGYIATITPSTSGSVTLASSFNGLSWVKNGRSVQVTGRLKVQSVSSPVGYFAINLPFIAADLPAESGAATASIVVTGAVAAKVIDFVGYVLDGEQSVRVYLGDSSTLQSDSAQELQANTEIVVSVQYTTVN